jgi:hypothetical protein
MDSEQTEVAPVRKCALCDRPIYPHEQEVDFGHYKKRVAAGHCPVHGDVEALIYEPDLVDPTETDSQNET